ncbi:unnamed protein product, partial [Prorocentrum cordatum]
LLPLQALPPPAGGGGPGEQRSPAEIARAALRAPGGGDSTRRGVGASKWRGEDERGWMRDSRRTRQSSPYEAPRRQLERMGASKERSGQRGTRGEEPRQRLEERSQSELTRARPGAAALLTAGPCRRHPPWCPALSGTR